MSWLEQFEESYTKKGSFSHATPKIINLFPYTTAKVSNEDQAELRCFYPICSECLKDLAMVENEVECISSAIIASVKDSVESRGKFSDLQHIIRTTIFDENDRIHCFHPHVYYHISGQKKRKRTSLVGYFINDVLLNGDSDLAPDKVVDDSSLNVFHRLILSALPPLNDRNKKRDVSYYRYDESLSEYFLQDYLFLKEDPALYSSHLPELLRFYCFVYQLRLLEGLESFFDPIVPEPVYFSVDWESLSKGRLTYQAGWNRFENKLFVMFSHAQCLEMINYIPFQGLEPPFSYKDIRSWNKDASCEDKKSVAESLDTLIDYYKSSIEDLGFDWSRHAHGCTRKNKEEELEHKVRQFFKIVHCQFENSNRKAAAGRYSKWLSHFAAAKYLKRRGPLGNTLILDRTQLLFLTRLCIGRHSEGKLRLTTLWEEFANRGVAFDFETKTQIIKLFNKLNLIEKKSDSGDAQYVRAVF